MEVDCNLKNYGLTFQVVLARLQKKVDILSYTCIFLKMIKDNVFLWFKLPSTNLITIKSKNM